MFRLVFFLFTLLASIAHAQPYYDKPSLIPVENGWKIDSKTRVGATTRIKATQQNPLPFCFSTAAAMLFDQTRCTRENKNCEQQLATSFLAATPAGQKLEMGEIDIVTGGNPYLSLNHILTNGFTTLDKCNYSQLETGNHLYNEIQNMTFLKSQWNRYKKYSNYLGNYYKNAFYSLLENYSKNISNEMKEVLLTGNFSNNEISSILLMKEDCWTNLQTDNRFTIKVEHFKNNQKSAFTTAEKLLLRKIPFILNFCTNYTNTLCDSNNLHSFIVIAKAKAVNIITGDSRSAVWVVNSWGEEWQKKHADGWVFADALFANAIGEIIWLELK